MESAFLFSLLPDAKIINLACNVFFLTQTFPAAFLPLFKGKLYILFLTELFFVTRRMIVGQA